MSGLNGLNGLNGEIKKWRNVVKIGLELYLFIWLVSIVCTTTY